MVVYSNFILDLYNLLLYLIFIIDSYTCFYCVLYLRCMRDCLLIFISYFMNDVLFILDFYNWVVYLIFIIDLHT